MSFIDTLLTEDPICTVVLADRNASAGGHWTTAYPFVKLHQTSSNYGVNSVRLGLSTDRRGREKEDANDLRAGEEVCEYYNKVTQQFLDSGRVRCYFNTEYSCDADDDGKKSGQEQHHLLLQTSRDDDVPKKIIVKCQRKIVTCVSKLIVPSMRKGVPSFPIHNYIEMKPLNELTNEISPRNHTNYVVIGAGKSGMDSIVYLLDNLVDKSHITWIISRDVWFFIRDNLYPNRGASKWKDKKKFINPCFDYDNATDIFLEIERHGIMGRLQPSSPDIPQVFKAPVLSQREVDLVRSMEPTTVRLGRITEITDTTIVLEKGTIPIPGPTEDTLFVDCMAEDFYGYSSFDSNLKIFDGRDKIHIGPMLQFKNPSFSSAIIAYVEANFEDSKIDKNQFCYFASGSELAKPNLTSFLYHFYAQLKTLQALQKYGPATKFIMSSRTNLDSPLHRGGLFKLLWAVFGPQRLKAKGDRLVRRIENGDIKEISKDTLAKDPILGQPALAKIPKKAIKKKAKKKGIGENSYPPIDGERAFVNTIVIS